MAVTQCGQNHLPQPFDKEDEDKAKKWLESQPPPETRGFFNRSNAGLQHDRTLRGLPCFRVKNRTDKKFRILVTTAKNTLHVVREERNMQQRRALQAGGQVAAGGPGAPSAGASLHVQRTAEETNGMIQVLQPREENPEGELIAMQWVQPAGREGDERTFNTALNKGVYLTFLYDLDEATGLHKKLDILIDIYAEQRFDIIERDLENVQHNVFFDADRAARQP